MQAASGGAIPLDARMEERVAGGAVGLAGEHGAHQQRRDQGQHGGPEARTEQPPAQPA